MKLRHLIFGMISMTAISPATFGFDLALFILGMTGGVVRSVIHDNINIRSALVNMFVGAVVANYFTKICTNYFHITEKDSIFATALILGFFAVGIFVVLEKLEDWAKENPRTFFAWVVNGLSSLLKGDQNKNKNNGDQTFHGNSDN